MRSAAIFSGSVGNAGFGAQADRADRLPDLLMCAGHGKLNSTGMEVKTLEANGMQEESHSEYLERKSSEYRKEKLFKNEIKEQARVQAELKLQEKRAASKAAVIAKRTAEAARIASLSPEQRQQEHLEKRIKNLGPQIKTGNLLGWSNGSGWAAHTSRYQQACKLNTNKLSLPEAEESQLVVDELLQYYKPGKTLSILNKLKVIRLELKQNIQRLKAKEKAMILEAKKLLKTQKQRIPGNADKGFASGLIAAIEDARNQTGGFVYLKQWTLADGTRWFKVGITNNPSRRDTEQNVLPVPAVTLKLMKTQSMDQAIAIEKAIHQQLVAQKVRGAGNRELFHLNDAQLEALMAAMS